MGDEALAAEVLGLHRALLRMRARLEDRAHARPEAVAADLEIAAAVDRALVGAGRAVSADPAQVGLRSGGRSRRGPARRCRDDECPSGTHASGTVTSERANGCALPSAGRLIAVRSLIKYTTV